MAYAIIFMKSLEENLLRKVPLTTLVRWRYIDDIFMVWEQGKKKLKGFYRILITIILLKIYSRILQGKNFLDVTIMKKYSQLVIDLYVIPTDIH